jgi:hypothetical protein
MKSRSGAAPRNCERHPPHRLCAPPYDAAVLAATNWLLEVLQIPEMLPPAPINNAAEARATKARSNVYSIKSWP